MNTEYPNFNIERIGIVSHDYTIEDKNGKKDFSFSFSDILSFIDKMKCDSLLFSLYTIDTSNEKFEYLNHLQNFKYLKCIFFEEFGSHKNSRYYIYFNSNSTWKHFELKQKFSTLQKINDAQIKTFMDEVKSVRNFGNFSILLCGESNIVKYSMERKQVDDKYSYLTQLTNTVEIILNPIHDKMTRFEMRLKRKFLSQNEKLVISVWNKGKKDKNGRIRDGSGPPWNIFYCGREHHIQQIPHQIHSATGIEIGIVDLSKIKEGNIYV